MITVRRLRKSLIFKRAISSLSQTLLKMAGGAESSWMKTEDRKADTFSLVISFVFSDGLILPVISSKPLVSMFSLTHMSLL
jgi:hypothetical protein